MARGVEQRNLATLGFNKLHFNALRLGLRIHSTQHKREKRGCEGEQRTLSSKKSNLSGGLVLGAGRLGLNSEQILMQKSATLSTGQTSKK